MHPWCLRPTCHARWGSRSGYIATVTGSGGTQVIDLKNPRGTLFTSPALVKDYLRTKLASFEHEVFAALFLDSQHRLIEYVELFRGTID